MKEIDKVGLLLNKEQKVLCEETISNCDEAFPFFMREISLSTVERFVALFMNYDYKPICCSTIGIGSGNRVNIDIAEIFKIGLLVNAKHFIVAHNHLGSSVTPTEDDISATQKIGYIGKIVNINLIDSLIVNSEEKCLSIRKYISERSAK